MRITSGIFRTRPKEVKEHMDKKNSDDTRLVDVPSLVDGEKTFTKEIASQESISVSRTRGFEHANEILRATVDADKRILNKRFVLDDVLGQGGMGWVCKAKDLRKVEAEDSNPFVAIKLLNTDLENHPDAFITLQQEAVKSQTLAHPNIATVYDFDRDGDTLYMTMELLKGDPLDQLIDHEAPFGKEVAMRYFTEMASGLEYAHKRALVHADFKPANVFVTTSGMVKILDFGIAQAIKDRRGSALFSEDTIEGFTPAFATCELANGEPPTESDDIYALACVLYLMLTGKHPYKKKSAEIAKQEKLELVRPNSLTASEWRSLASALSPDKDLRPDSIRDFSATMIPNWRILSSSKSTLTVIAVIGLLFMIGISLISPQDGVKNSKELFEAYMKEIDSCEKRRDVTCLEMSLKNANTAAMINDFSKDQVKILNIRKKTLVDLKIQLDSYLSTATGCLKEALLDCAEKAYNDAYKLDGNNRSVIQLYNELQQAKMIQSRIQIWKMEAKECIDIKNYECVLNKAESILDLVPEHSWALRTKSDAKNAQLEAKRAILIN